MWTEIWERCAGVKGVTGVMGVKDVKSFAACEDSAYENSYRCSAARNLRRLEPEVAGGAWRGGVEVGVAGG